MSIYFHHKRLVEKFLLEIFDSIKIQYEGEVNESYEKRLRGGPKSYRRNFTFDVFDPYFQWEFSEFSTIYMELCSIT